MHFIYKILQSPTASAILSSVLLEITTKSRSHHYSIFVTGLSRSDHVSSIFTYSSTLTSTEPGPGLSKLVVITVGRNRFDYIKKLDSQFWGFGMVCRISLPTTFWDPQQLSKRRQEIYPTHHAKTRKPRISIHYMVKV
jgi:hypothetical protein